MRVVSILLWVASIGFLLFWAFAYMYIHGLACAYGNPNSTTCRIDLPWQLGGEDLLFLIVYPGIVFLILIGLAILAGRAANRP
jgi:hypothetical protein